MPNGSRLGAREMLRRQDAGDDAERAVVLAGVDHGVDMRADQEPRLRARRSGRARVPSASSLTDRPAARIQPATRSAARRCSGVRNSRTSRPGSAEIAPSSAIIASARVPNALGIGRAHDRSSTLIVVSSIASAVDQNVHDDGERGRAAGPAEPAEHKPRRENLRHAEPVVLDMQQRPGQRNHGDGQHLAAGTHQSAIEEAAEGDLLPDRRNHDDGQHQPDQPAGVFGALIGFDLERRHQIAAADIHQRVERRRSSATMQSTAKTISPRLGQLSAR